MTSQASLALTRSDPHAAQEVIDAFDDVSVSGLITRIVYAQGKTAMDSSVGNAVIQSLADLGEMGGIARSIAKIALSPEPTYAVSSGVNDCIAQMGESAASLAASFDHILSTGSTVEFRRAEDDMAEARRALLGAVADQLGYGVPSALHVMRIDSCFDRYTARAALVAQRMLLVFVNSGGA